MKPEHHTVKLTDAHRLAVVRELGVILDDGTDRDVPAGVLLEQYTETIKARRESEAQA